MYNEFIKSQKEMITMKVLIWLFCFFVVAVIQTAAREAGLILGAIPAMLLFGLAWWSAKKLCALWDQRQAEKVAFAVSESPVPDPLPTEQEPATSAPAPATPKLRYCKLCGAPIDPVTRKCTDCRKQYFRPPVLHKKHLAIAAGVLACAAVVFLVTNLVSSLASQKDAAQAQIDDLNARITELEEKVTEQERQINVYKRNESSYLGQLASKDDTIENLREKNNLMSYEIAFYDRHVVFVADDGTKKYHNYSCEYLDLSYFWAYNTEAAEDRGYKPCSHCCD